MATPSLSLQEQFAPNSICFGCGPANHKGLRIRSFIREDKVDGLQCSWYPSPEHQAFPGMLNGGIIGSVLDCHSNWTAAYKLMQTHQWATPQCTVTAWFKITLLRPTPFNVELKLLSEVKSIEGKKALITSSLYTLDDKECAQCEGLFVAVKEGHPAYHRWG